METKTSHVENINERGSLIASSDPSMSANQVVTLINCKIICKPSPTPPFNVSKMLKHNLFSKIEIFAPVFLFPIKMPGHAFHRIVS